MRNVDFSPLYRSFVGLDRLAHMVDHASRQEKQTSFPPYNVELVAEDKYQITMAIAGFSYDELEIEFQQNNLVVKGQKPAPADDVKQKQFLYQGIAERNFERKFQLGDHVKVIDAGLENGLLTIELERELPDALKPRKIAINKGGKLIETAAEVAVE